jgi:hypothetical protein
MLAVFLGAETGRDGGRLTGFFSTEEGEPWPVAAPRPVDWGSARSRAAVFGDIPPQALAVMRAPTFEPRYVSPLHFAAIGSGSGVVRELYESATFILQSATAGGAGDAIADRMRTWALETGDPAIGGLYPSLWLSKDGVQVETYSRRFPSGVEIGIEFQAGVWTQRNLKTGRQLTLLPPWQLIASPSDETFRDFDLEMEEFLWQPLPPQSPNGSERI